MPLRAAAFEILRKCAVFLREKGLFLNGVQKVVSSNLTAPTILPETEPHIGRSQPGRGCGEHTSLRVCTHLNDDNAVTVEGVSLICTVRVVIAAVAIATCQCPATASKLESDMVVCVGNQPAFSIQNGDWNHQ